MCSRLIAVVLIALSALSTGLGSPSAGEAHAAATTIPGDSTRGDSTPDGSTPDDSATTTLDNRFLPEEANIGDCISALPRPDCGSKARGGWRQGLVFAAVAAAVVAVGIRLTTAIRRRDAADRR